MDRRTNIQVECIAYSGWTRNKVSMSPFCRLFHFAVQTPAGSCSSQSSPQDISTTLTTSSGYLSSIISDVTGCGRAEWPWSVVVHPGQTIRVRLYDFGLRDRRQSIGSSQTTTPRSTAETGAACVEYALLSEPGTNQSNVTVCGSQQRLSLVLTTSSNKLDVAFTHHGIAHRRTPHFLLYYEGLVWHAKFILCCVKHLAIKYSSVLSYTVPGSTHLTISLSCP